jgi:L-iditol 2-dehydrogenase
MKAVVKTTPEPGIRVMEMHVPEPPPGEVVVQVEAVGICGSDVHIYEWTPGYAFLIEYFPLILGHEFAGHVVKVGPGTGKTFRHGDRVTSETAKTCGKCLFCKQGKGILCPQRKAHGRIGLERNGAMARYVTVAEECLHRVPSSVSLEEAALTEPAAVALGAAQLPQLYPGDMAVILGPGPIGLLVLQMVKALGAGIVVVIGQESDNYRLRVARELAADETLIGTGEATFQRVMELTDGEGAGIVFEVSGSPEAAGHGLRMLRKGGEMVLVGIYPEAIPLDATHELVRQMKSVRGSYGGASLDWERVLRLVAARKVHLKPLITEIMPLGRAREAFEMVRRKEALKVLLKPADEGGQEG